MTPAHPMFTLRLIEQPDGGTPGIVRAVPPGGLTLGRSPECDVVLPDQVRLVSRVHARLEPRADGLYIHSLSASTPIWLNEQPHGHGAVTLWHPGERLRIAGFVFALEVPAPAPPPVPLPVQPPQSAPLTTPAPWQAPAAPAQTAAPPDSPAPARGRIDTWFDLGSMRALPASVTPPPSTVTAPPDPTPEAGLTAPAHTTAPVPQAATQPAPETVQPEISTPAPPPTDLAGFQAALQAALLQGAGLPPDARWPVVTPMSMQQLGRLLRASVDGVLALLQGRATVKDGMGMEGTRIAQHQNNPLKFVPDAQAALEHLLGLHPARGYLAPAEAVADAHQDLQMHHLAVMAGMRAAVLELFDRLGPDAVVSEQADLPFWQRLWPGQRDAALWRRHVQRHQQLRLSLDEDFAAVFGQQFRQAYQAQTRQRQQP